MRNDAFGWGRIAIGCMLAMVCLTGCAGLKEEKPGRWHERYSFVDQITPITFHYHHGILAGSYPDAKETVDVRFEDVCAQLGHVCLCGAGGFRIASEATNALADADRPIERGSLIVISSRDHTVSDVIAFVLGSVRRDDPEQSQYLIDSSIKAARREYRYYIGCPASRTAVCIVYRKHLLIGNEAMDQLWKIELAFDEDPSSVSQEEIERYSTAMRSMVFDVLFDRIPGLVEVRNVPYEEFAERIDRLCGHQLAPHHHSHH